VSLALTATSTILGLISGLALGVAVFWIQSRAITYYRPHTQDRKRLRWIAPALTVLLAVGLFELETDWAVALTKAVFGACLIALGSIDARFQVLPNALTLSLLATGLILSMIGLALPLGSALGGALMGFLLLMVPKVIYERWRQTEGVGWGDVKLTMAIGAWLGWEAVLQAVLVASLLVAFFGLAMTLLRGQGWNQLLPFGPFISLAAVIGLVL